MSRPKLLDLCCCEGGTMRGYADAGYDVYGADFFADYTQARNPYPTHRGDAVLVMLMLLAGERVRFNDGSVLGLVDFAVVAGSPPCHRWTAGTRAGNRDKYPDLITPMRAFMRATGLPYVIENVPAAPLVNPITLCGRQFGLTAVDEDGTPLVLDRHRCFESNVQLTAPPSCHPHDRTVQVAGSYGGARRDKAEARDVRHGGYVPAAAVQARLLGIDWMTQKGLYQAIPPVYTRWIGQQLLAHIESERAA